jgi:hypothetical protein
MVEIVVEVQAEVEVNYPLERSVGQSGTLFCRSGTCSL